MKWGFVGGAYEAANPMQDDQALVNWYVETDRTAGAKEARALLGVPGKAEAVASSYSGEVRGGHVMPDGTEAYLVIGSTVVKMSVAQAAGPGLATFQLTTVGVIGTKAGPVCMRDNGAANICVIVDGEFMYAINHATGAFGMVTDANVINPDRLASIDGILIWNSNGSQKFNTTAPYWNGTDAFDGTFFALKDDAPDNLVTLIEDNRELWLVGEKTTEVWYNAGNTSATGVVSMPFARLQGAMLQVGCAAAHSIARTGKGLMWLGKSERGENYLVQTEGYDFQVVSNPAFSYALTQYPVTSDAVAYTYTEEGHEFYQITFPSADVTWVYDLTEQLWHQRQSMDATGVTHRDRANCLINFAGQRIVGDYQSGKLYRQSRSLYTDGAYPLVARRRSPYVWDGDDRLRVVHQRLQIEFTPGVGTATGQGQNPQMMLRWRDEKGWSNEHLIPIGLMGQTRNRAIARRLGSSRYRVYEVSFSDPVPRDIVGASLQAGGTKS